MKSYNIQANIGRPNPRRRNPGPIGTKLALQLRRARRLRSILEARPGDVSAQQRLKAAERSVWMLRKEVWNDPDEPAVVYPAQKPLSPAAQAMLFNLLGARDRGRLSVGRRRRNPSTPGDLTYKTYGMFTMFFPDTPAGETAWREIARQTEGTGKIFTAHLPATLRQLRKAGYKVVGK